MCVLCVCVCVCVCVYVSLCVCHCVCMCMCDRMSCMTNLTSMSLACMLKIVWYMIAQTKYHVSENILLIIQHVEIFSSMTN